MTKTKTEFFFSFLLSLGTFTSVFKDDKYSRSHKTLNFFACWWQDPDSKPDPVLTIPQKCSPMYQSCSMVASTVPNLLILHGMIRIATSCWWCCGTWCTPTPRCGSSWCRRPLTRPSSHPISATVPLWRWRAALSSYRFGSYNFANRNFTLPYCTNSFNILFHQILCFFCLFI